MEDLSDEAVYLLWSVSSRGMRELAEMALTRMRRYREIWTWSRGRLLKRRLVRERRRAISPSMPWLPDDRRGKEGPGIGGKGQRAAAGPPASTASTAPDGAGFLPRPLAAGIRFYAGYGGAGFLPRRVATGIRFYAGYGGAGFLPRPLAAGIREGVGPGVQANRLLSRRPDGVPGGGGVGI